MPGPVTWDALASYLHYEAQAFLGAVRMSCDELVYVAARRAGVPAKKASERPWETHALVTAPAPPTLCLTAEIQALRSQQDWFETLNIYRNSMYHHGWRHGAGHFDPTDLRTAASRPSMNALLVPDRGSLKSRAKPDKWTYSDARTLDRLITEIGNGLDVVLETVCRTAWATPVPTPGRMPREEHPNMFIPLAHPPFLVLPSEIVVALFSTEARGRVFDAIGDASRLELVELRPVAGPNGASVVYFSVAGLKKMSVPPHITTIRALIDPQPLDPDWQEVAHAGEASSAIATLLEHDVIPPVSIPTFGHDRLYVWQQPFEMGWM